MFEPIGVEPWFGTGRVAVGTESKRETLMRQRSGGTLRASVAGVGTVVAGALGLRFTRPVGLESRPLSAGPRRARVVLAAVGTLVAVGVWAGSALASSPSTIFKTPGTVVVACPSHSECVAGNEAGQEVTFNPLSPGTPTPSSILPAGDRSGVAGIACPSVSQCTATLTGSIYSDVNAVTFNPLSPGTTTPVTFAGSGSSGPVPWWGISCPSPNQCTAVDGSAVVTFNPASPGTPTPTAMAGSGYLDRIACASTSQCTAVGAANETIGGGGAEVTFDPAAPGTLTPGALTSDVALQGIACPSASRCDAVGEPFGVFSGSAAEVSFDPTSPGTPAPTTLAKGGASAVACPSPTQCTALVYVSGVINSSMEITFNPASPGTPTPTRIGGGIDASSSLACPSLSQCTAVGVHTTPPSVGQEITFNPTSPNSSTGDKWSAARCTSTYKAWIRQHKHATTRQKKNEASSLQSSHGCPRSSS
jgi:hypothetical protein